MKKNLGFTLIELMIVVAIIAIIAAIAIPSLLRSRMSANEAGAIGSLRTISAGEISFQAAAYKDTAGDGVGDYGTLAELEDPDGVGGVPGFIDEVLAAGSKHGYAFTLVTVDGGGGAVPSYTCNADPQSPQSGRRTFFMNESGVIRFENTGAAATATSTPLG